MIGALTKRARWWSSLVVGAVVVAALSVGACAPGTPGPGLDPDRVRAHVGALLELGPRVGDSEAARRAATYIEQAIRVGGGPVVERLPVGAVDLPAIAVLGQVFRTAHRVETSDPDLMVRFGPPGKVLLIMAHYDSVPGSPGAVDNAAAVGTLIELARALDRAAPPFGVMLVFTANEERGLVGAEALAARIGEEVTFALALDLIGGTGELSINGASELVGAAELRWLAAAAERAGTVLRAPLPHRVLSRWWPQAERSDHGPFTRRQIRAIHLYDRGQDGEWIDLAYHSERDVYARVDRAAVDDLGRLLVALTAQAPPAHAGDGFWVPVVHGLVVSRALLIAIELVLAAGALLSLLSLRTARERGGSGLVVWLVGFAAAAALTCTVERLAAGAHPAPWLHAPLVAVVAELLVLVGTLATLGFVVRRLRPWVGALRYLAVSACVLLVLGVGCLALGAAELAWIWLGPALLVAVAPRFAALVREGRLRLVGGGMCVIGALAPAFPLVLVLAPNQLREMAWNGLLPTSVPLGVWVAALALPLLASGTWWVRQRPPQGPLGALVLPLGCLLSALAGVVLVGRTPPRCTATDFNQFHLACEVRQSTAQVR